MPISEAVVSISSGWITESLGRKKVMLMMNIAHAIAWMLLYSAQSVTEIYVAHILHGFGIGFISAAVKTYIGEIWYRLTIICSFISLEFDVLFVFHEIQSK